MRGEAGECERCITYGAGLACAHGGPPRYFHSAASHRAVLGQHGGCALNYAATAFAAFVALAHQTSSSSAAFADGIRLASISSIGFLPNIG
jgi:hypothetical protein